ncbi:MAG TPA: Cof-type HAD-IIB family hydrolase [Atopostipes sp.]|nr:Cof-type HAD-IIB family hydrolase [Atopostipes sp.]
MKKLVFFDIDGTLVTRNNSIPKSTVKAINQLKRNGAIPVIATGRAPVLMNEIAKELDIDSYISMNGQYIVHEGEVIYSNPIDMEIVDEVVEVATERRDGILLSTADEIIANSMISLVNRGSWYTFLKGLVGIIPERVKAKLWHRMMKKVPEKEDYEHKEILMMNINANQEQEQEYRKIFSNHLEFTRANQMSMDIVNKGVSKATGAEMMISALGVNHENTFAFGDGLNDMEIINYVATGIAMENGFEELKATADYVTDSVFNHGIAKGLKKLELI